MQDAKQANIGLERSDTGASLGRCLVDGDAAATVSGVRARRKAFGLSVGIEAATVALLIVAPLLSSVAQPQLHQLTPPMIVNLVGWRTHSTNQNIPTPSNRPAASLRFWDFRPQIPDAISNSHEKLESGDAAPPEEIGDAIPGAVQLAGLGVTPSKVPPPAPIHQEPQEKRPVRVSGDIEQALLIDQIEPRYPFLALQIKLQGTVVLYAIINRDGRITSLEVVSGSPLLVQSALDAVRRWRYRPTLLNGAPVEVETTITVTFRLTP